MHVGFPASAGPWDIPFNRAVNAYKNRNKFLPPTSAGRVSGFGTSMKFGEYYKDDIKKRRERKSQSSAKEKEKVEQLQKQVESIPDIVAQKVEERIRDIIPPELMEGLAAWNAAGRVGPI